MIACKLNEYVFCVIVFYYIYICSYIVHFCALQNIHLLHNLSGHFSIHVGIDALGLYFVKSSETGLLSRLAKTRTLLNRLVCSLGSD